MRDRHRGRWGVALVTALVTSSVLMSAPFADAKPNDGKPGKPSDTPKPSVPDLVWGPCLDLPEELGGQTFECATAIVPLDYDKPKGATIEVALAKYPASKPAEKIGSLFINPGGPGGSGVNLAYGIGADLDAGLGGRFDIIGFDPRGVARSTPLECFATNTETMEFLSAVPGFPYERSMERPYFDHWSSLRSICETGDATVINHMSTADVARDLDLLRRAVGDSKLTFLGFSYGSFLGQTYANMFPDKVRAMAIDGVLDPKRFSNGRQIKYDEWATQKVMNEFLRLCDEAAVTDPALCTFSRGRKGAKARWNELLGLVRAKPIELGGDNPAVSYDVLLETTLGVLYDPSSWAGYAAQLDGLLRFANGETPAPVGSARFGIGDIDSEPYMNMIDSFYGNHCSDAQYPVSLRSWSRRGAQASASSPFGGVWWWQSVPCSRWPVDEDRYAGPWRPRTDTPFLVVGSEFDPATPIEGAKTASNYLGRDRLVTYEGYGHVAWGMSECATNLIHDYLRTVKLPAKKDSVCAAPPNPFAGVTTMALDSRAALDEILAGVRPGR